MDSKNNWVVEPTRCGDCPFYQHYPGVFIGCILDPTKDVEPTVEPLEQSIPETCPLRHYNVLVRI